MGKVYSGVLLDVAREVLEISADQLEELAAGMEEDEWEAGLQKLGVRYGITLEERERVGDLVRSYVLDCKSCAQAWSVLPYAPGERHTCSKCGATASVPSYRRPTRHEMATASSSATGPPRRTQPTGGFAPRLRLGGSLHGYRIISPHPGTGLLPCFVARDVASTRAVWLQALYCRDAADATRVQSAVERWKGLGAGCLRVQEAFRAGIDEETWYFLVTAPLTGLSLEKATQHVGAVSIQPAATALAEVFAALRRLLVAGGSHTGFSARHVWFHRGGRGLLLPPWGSPEQERNGPPDASSGRETVLAAGLTALQAFSGKVYPGRLSSPQSLRHWAEQALASGARPPCDRLLQWLARGAEDADVGHLGALIEIVSDVARQGPGPQVVGTQGSKGTRAWAVLLGLATVVLLSSIGGAHVLGRRRLQVWLRALTGDTTLASDATEARGASARDLLYDQRSENDLAEVGGTDPHELTAIISSAQEMDAPPVHERQVESQATPEQRLREWLGTLLVIESSTLAELLSCYPGSQGVGNEALPALGALDAAVQRLREVYESSASFSSYYESMIFVEEQLRSSFRTTPLRPILERVRSLIEHEILTRWRGALEPGSRDSILSPHAIAFFASEGSDTERFLATLATLSEGGDSGPFERLGSGFAALLEQTTVAVLVDERILRVQLFPVSNLQWYFNSARETDSEARPADLTAGAGGGTLRWLAPYRVPSSRIDVLEKAVRTYARRHDGGRLPSRAEAEVLGPRLAESFSELRRDFAHREGSRLLVALQEPMGRWIWSEVCEEDLVGKDTASMSADREGRWSGYFRVVVEP